MPDEQQAEPGTESPESYAHWDQEPALGRRGMVLAVVIPVLIAAAGFGVVAAVSQGTETAATALNVPTSGWIDGQPAGSSTFQGTLEVDERRCVYLQGAEGEIWPVWPAGYRARLDDSGKVSLYDGGDDLVARSGESIQATGTVTSSDAFEGETCLPSDDDVAVVQSEVTRLG